MKIQKKWTIIKIALLIVFLIVGIVEGPATQQSVPPMTLLGLLMIFLGLIVGLQFIIGVQVINPKSDKLWRNPSWEENPFQLKQPLQFFHFVGFSSICFGISSLIIFGVTQKGYIYETLIPLVMGIGIILGIFVCKLLFKKKFE